MTYSTGIRSAPIDLVVVCPFVTFREIVQNRVQVLAAIPVYAATVPR